MDSDSTSSLTKITLTNKEGWENQDRGKTKFNKLKKKKKIIQSGKRQTTKKQNKTTTTKRKKKQKR